MPSNRPLNVDQWHPDVHKKWAHEELYFWKLGFTPIYNRDQIVKGIEDALAKQVATSFTIYELKAGPEDIIVRVWLPTEAEPFDDAVRECLKRYRVKADSFRVERIIAHWPWQTESDVLAVRPVLERTLNEPRPDEEILKINTRTPSRALRKRYEALKLIARSRSRKGVTFFTVIGRLDRARDQDNRQTLEEHIKSVLRNAASIDEKSLYAGSGSGEYLLVGRAREYFAIEREITRPLNEKVDPGIDGARTMTFPTSRPNPLATRDDLKVDGRHVW